MTTRFAFRLETRWTPPRDGEPLVYEIRLVNEGSEPVADFSLCVSGPARIDPAATIAGATLTRRLSNHSELRAPQGYALEPGATWAIEVHGLSYPLRHWSDGATSAYVTLDDGRVVPVLPTPTMAIGQNSPLRKGTQKYPVPAMAPVPVSVIPWPAKAPVSGRRAVPAGLDPQSTTAAGTAATAAFLDLTAMLFPAEGIVRPASEGGIPVRLVEDAALGAEAYGIAFAEGVSIRAATQTGFFYGLVTLGQIWRGARHYPETFAFPAEGEIEDAPAHGFRGSHLDVARQFYSTAEVTQFLRLLAWHKMNRFHWHLSDDEAWRLEIDAFPALTEIAAWRGHGLPVPPLLGSGPERQGGFYSKAAVRDIVALAASFGITVIPEIDIPGHCFALQQAIPELRDPGEHGDYSSVQGFPNNCINPAREQTYAILETILDEVIELFPSTIIHVGADEVPIGAWSGSPEALAKLSEIGGPAMAAAHAKRLNVTTNTHGADDIEGSGAAALQAIFLGRIQAFLASRGCITGGWEEVAHGDVVDKEKVYLVGWRSVEVNAALAGRGYDVVVSPGQSYYLDMSQSNEWAEPGAGWAGWSSVEKTYEFEATEGWTALQKQHFLGVQACIWSEPMSDRAVFDRLVFPRLSAIAEAGWTPKERKSFKRFTALVGLMPNLYGHWSD